MVENRREVKVFNVYAECSCGGRYQENNPFIIWDNKNTISLEDDTFSYSYICDNCSDTILNTKKYPYQEFVEI